MVRFGWARSNFRLKPLPPHTHIHGPKLEELVGVEGVATPRSQQPLLQTGACPGLQSREGDAAPTSSASKTRDRDFFLGPLEWATAEAGS